MIKKVHKKILVIDDDPVTVRMLEKVLRRDRYEVIKALNGKTGLAKAKDEVPFLILLDVLMPDMNGMEVARKLKGDLATKDIPIIFLTITIPLEKDKGRETINVDGTLYRAMAKPMHTAKLLSMIRKEINKRIHCNI